MANEKIKTMIKELRPIVNELNSEKFNHLQIGEIIKGIMDGLGENEISAYTDPKFSSDQMRQIRKGLNNGVDTSIYTNPKFGSDQMKEIRYGLEGKLDVSKYADPKFDYEQMGVIREGIKSGVDVLIYADPKFDADQMCRIRQMLESKSEEA